MGQGSVQPPPPTCPPLPRPIGAAHPHRRPGMGTGGAWSCAGLQAGPRCSHSPPPPPPSAVPCTVWGGRAQEPWALKQEPHPRFPDLAFLFLFVFFFSFFPKHERCRRGRRRWGKGGGGRAAPRVPSGRGRAVPEPLWMLLAPGGVVVVQTRRAEAGTTHYSADTAASLQPARRSARSSPTFFVSPPPPHPIHAAPIPALRAALGAGGGGGLLCIWPIPAGCIQQRNPAGVPPAASALPAACLPLLLLSV